MSTAGEINEAEGYVAAAYRAVAEKGGELPPQKNLANLKLAVDDIPLGDGTEWGTLYTTAYPDGLVLDSEKSYKALGNSSAGSDVKLYPNNIAIEKGSITGFSFGKNCTYAPLFFLTNCIHVVRLDHTAVLRTIGDSFLRFAKDFNAPLNLRNVTSIGSLFLSECITFAQPIYLSPKLDTIGSGFVSRVRKFVGPVYIDTTAIPADRSNSYNSLSSIASFDDTYSQGITITGPGAAAWKEALPNVQSTANGYRKLILVEE